jgi:RecA-family ATPase
MGERILTSSPLARTGPDRNRTENDLEWSPMPSMRKFVQQVRAKPSLPFIVDELIPAQPGYILLAGPAGIGKTHLTTQLLTCLAEGADFLGFHTSSIKGSYLGFEGGKEMMCERIEKILKFCSNGVADMVSFDIIPTKRLSGNESWFMDMAELDGKELSVLAIDPLKYLIGSDYTKPGEAIRFIERLQAFHDHNNLVMFLTHHIRKRDQRSILDPSDIMDEVKGAGDYADHATTVMVLERERQLRVIGDRGFAPVRKGYFTLHFPKARHARGTLEPITLRFNKDTLQFEKVEPVL